MKLPEHRAKEIFRSYGLETPRGGVAATPEEAGEVAEELGCPAVVKAQVLVGGRGLAGGVKAVEASEQVPEVAGSIFGESLKGKNVDRVLVEEEIPIEREYYLSATIDYEARRPVIMASSMGGVEIEATAADHPEAIVRELVESPLGLTDYQARRIAKKIGLSGREMTGFARVITALHRMLHELDASLVEVNPLALTPDGRFVALDAKMTLDDGAEFRHRGLFSELTADRTPPTAEDGVRRAMAEEAEIPTYIELDGEIGIIADGAGTGMLTFDLVKEHGGRIETYCELGGKAGPALMEAAMRVVLSNEDVRVLLVNVIGGLNRMDEMAEGITAYVSGGGPSEAEIVVRMSGTLEEEGRRILESRGIMAYDNIYEAIERTVRLAGGS